MPSPFSITVVTPRVQLDSQWRGEASYTVGNILGRPIRGRARLVTSGQWQVDWLQLDGDAERDYSVNGTQTYSIHIQAPAGTAVGDYSFRLDMVGVENPDELFTQGPPVTVQVLTVPPPPKVTVKKGYLITVAGAVIGGLVGATVAAIVASVIHNEAIGRFVSPAVYAILIGLGSWIALNTGECDWGRETALVLGGISLVGAIIALSALTENLAIIFVFLAGLVIPALIARAIILQWKTGHV